MDLIERLRTYASTRKGELAELITEAADALERPTCEDAVSRADVLETYADLYDVFEDSRAICKELHKVYDRINALPAVQPEPKPDENGSEPFGNAEMLSDRTTDDCISRQETIGAILAVTGNSSVRELYEHVQEHELSDMWSGGVNAAIDVIIAVPSAQPTQSNASNALKTLDCIDRQAAIEAIDKALSRTFTEPCGEMILKDVPSAQPETHEERTETHDVCLDTISRQAAIDFIDAGHLCNPNEPRWSDNEIVNFLKSRPSAQPVRLKGRWIERNPQNSDKCRLIECDQCGFSHIVGFNVPYEHWIENRNFCERCGADMRGENR